MRSIVRLLGRWFPWMIMLCVALGSAGCEGDSEQHIWDGVDFGNNDPNLYVAMGNSITAGYGLDGAAYAYPFKLSMLLEKSVVNYSVSGSRSSYGADNVYSVLGSYQPGYLLILYGANDLIHGHSAESVISNLRAMIAAAKASQTIPVIATLTPVFDSHGFIEGAVIELNAAIRELGIEENVYVVDLGYAFNWDPVYMGSDGLHPTSEGHDLIAATFYDVLK